MSYTVPAAKWRQQRAIVLDLQATLRDMGKLAKRDLAVRRFAHLVSELDRSFGLLPDIRKI